MPAPLPIRDDLGPNQLRALARRERDGRVGARLRPTPRRPEACRGGAAGRDASSDMRN